MKEINEGDQCPKCKECTLQYGYGLCGGGIGVYEYCQNEACEYFYKTQNPEIGDCPHD